MMSVTLWTIPFTQPKIFNVFILVATTRTKLTGWKVFSNSHDLFSIPFHFEAQPGFETTKEFAFPFVLDTIRPQSADDVKENQQTTKRPR